MQRIPNGIQMGGKHLNEVSPGTSENSNETFQHGTSKGTPISSPNQPNPSQQQTTEHPIRFSKYSFLVPREISTESKSEYEPQFTTNVFKNSHFNTAHYNNLNFQPEIYEPVAYEAHSKVSGSKNIDWSTIGYYGHADEPSGINEDDPVLVHPRAESGKARPEENTATRAWLQDTKLDAATAARITKQHPKIPRDAKITKPVEEIDDSDNSDVESIMSDTASLTSSISSVGGVSYTAIADLKHFLHHHTELKPLYTIAITRVGPEKFQRNVRRLILRYGRALRHEAANLVQLQAARFVRISSARIAIEIKEDITGNSSTSRVGTSEGRQHLEGYLKDLEQENQLSSDEESLNDCDTLPLQTLENVKNFMVSSDAFMKLCDEFKEWLKLGNDLDRYPDTGDGDRGELDTSPWQATEDDDTEAQFSSGAKTLSFTNLECAQECFESRKSLQLPGHEGSEEISSRHLGWMESIFWRLNELRNMLSDHIQSRIAPGHVRVSWTCVSQKKCITTP